MTETQTRRHSRVGLITPLAIFLIALAAWTGWWFYLTTQVEGRLDAQAEALRQAGWQVAYADMSSSGWPFRTRVEADHVSVTAPSGHAVAAPVLVAEANAYNPNKWVVIAPNGLTLTRGGKGKVAVRGDAIRASVHGLTQRYPNLAVELVNPVFTSHEGAEAFPISRAARVELYSRPHIAPAADAPNDSVDVLFRLIDAHGRTGGPVEGMTQNGELTMEIETVIENASRLKGADAAGVFAAWSAAGGRFTEVRGELSAGESRATLASAVLSADADGRLTGQVALTAEKPLPAIAGLARSGSGAVNQAGAAGAAAATAVGGQGDVNLTLVFRDGRTFLGPFALAPAPKLF